MEDAEPELVAELVEERAELICAKNAELRFVQGLVKGLLRGLVRGLVSDIAGLVEERAELICAKNADLKIFYRFPPPPTD